MTCLCTHTNGKSKWKKNSACEESPALCGQNGVFLKQNKPLVHTHSSTYWHIKGFPMTLRPKWTMYARACVWSHLVRKPSAPQPPTHMQNHKMRWQMEMSMHMCFYIHQCIIRLLSGHFGWISVRHCQVKETQTSIISVCIIVSRKSLAGQRKVHSRSSNPNPTVDCRPFPAAYRRREAASHPYLTMPDTRRPPHLVRHRPGDGTGPHSPR